MTVLQALILGIVQGLGEFLPISSSGHLVLLQKMFGINEGALSFDILVHMGTLIALCVVMRKRLLEYLREPLGHIPRMVVLGTVPTVVIALVFGRFFNELFETGISLGFGFIFTALILYIAENKKNEGRGADKKRADYEYSSGEGYGTGNGNYDENGNIIGNVGDLPHEAKRRSGVITPAGALIVGVAQGIAVTPAVSRSGSTIAAGVICDFGKPAAIEFAFLMSIPVTLMAAAQDLLKIIINARAGTAGATGAAGAAGIAMNAIDSTSFSASTNAIFFVSSLLPYIIGFAASVVTGYFAARFMLKAIQKIKLTWFSIYVGALGTLILLDQLFFGIVFDKFIISM